MGKKSFFIVLTALLSFNLFSYTKPVVSNIKAESGKTTAISVSWTLPDSEISIKRIDIYRTLKPITNWKQLESESPLASISGDSTGFKDKVPNFKDFYYTVIAVTSSKNSFIVIPSENATVKGVHIQVPEETVTPDISSKKDPKLYPDGTLRETPLPFLDIIENQNKNKIKMGLEAQSVSKNLGTSQDSRKKRAITKPYVFEEDLISPDTGDDVFLFEILKTTFIQKKYKECQKELSKLLGRNISKSVSDRAIFYLGESLYFQGNYEKAVKNFLKTSEIYPVLSKKWIDSSLDLLELPEF